MSFACEIFMHKKKNASTTQCILLSGLNTGSKEGSEGKWAVETAKFVCAILGLSFFYDDPCGGEGEYPAAVPRGGRNRCWDVQALWYPQDLGNLLLQMPVLCMIYLAGCSSQVGKPRCCSPRAARAAQSIHSALCCPRKGRRRPTGFWSALF